MGLLYRTHVVAEVLLDRLLLALNVCTPEEGVNLRVLCSSACLKD
jgi:hypothetical protein